MTINGSVYSIYAEGSNPTPSLMVPMYCLGIEGTAHSFGAGVVESTPDGFKVLSNVIDMFRPPEGGIHPREAGDHHVEVSDTVINEALEKAGIAAQDLGLIAFSKGPGLGPCLRVAATAARTLSVSLKIPIVGVNHCVAHLEVGELLGAKDPVLLYTSGANTQVITFIAGRYRVLGETLDIGVGNMLDKFGRESDMPFPAGPEIEKMALMGGELIELPYSVKGMDVAFSGINTAALTKLENGAKMEDLCYSLQETVFSMLTEVTERAMAHTGKSEVLLGGGVACNNRLREMVRTMAEERGAKFMVPERPLCVDNGAMMALLGLKMHAAGVVHELEDTAVDQKFRTDDVDVLWREEPEAISAPEGPTGPGEFDGGAEATISLAHLQATGNDVVEKARVRKGYRIPQLDSMLRKLRGRSEVRAMLAATEAGVQVPTIYDLDEKDGVITMEYIPGSRLRDVLNADIELRRKQVAMVEFGNIIGTLHVNGMTHGDLTTSNVICRNNDEANQVLLDLSMGEMTQEIEHFGVDIRLLREAFESTHPLLMDSFHFIMRGYDMAGADSATVIKKVEEIDSRGRYLRGEG